MPFPRASTNLKSSIGVQRIKTLGCVTHATRVSRVRSPGAISPLTDERHVSRVKAEARRASVAARSARVHIRLCAYKREPREAEEVEALSNE